jgi:hypothetical protein
VPFVSAFNPRVAQGGEGYMQVLFGRITPSVVAVRDAARPMGREPGVDLGLPAVRELVSALEPPSGVQDVIEGRFEFSYGEGESPGG